MEGVTVYGSCHGLSFRALVGIRFVRIRQAGLSLAGDSGRGTPKKGSPCGCSWGKTRGRTRLEVSARDGAAKRIPSRA